MTKLNKKATIPIASNQSFAAFVVFLLNFLFSQCSLCLCGENRLIRDHARQLLCFADPISDAG
jgi:hypothetical protein